MRLSTFDRIQAIARIFHLINQGAPLSDRDQAMLQIIRSLTVDFDRVLAVLQYLGAIDRPVSTTDLQSVLGLSAKNTREVLRAIDYGFPLEVDNKGRSGYWYQPIEVGENLKELMEVKQ